MDIEFTKGLVKTIKESAEAEAGQWDGDESGELEDRARVCEDIIEACKNLGELLNELRGDCSEVIRDINQ